MSDDDARRIAQPPPSRAGETDRRRRPLTRTGPARLDFLKATRLGRALVPDPRAVLVEGETMIRPGRHAASSVVSTERSTRRMFAFRFHRDDDAERCRARRRSRGRRRRGLASRVGPRAARRRRPRVDTRHPRGETRIERRRGGVASTADAADERAPMDECAPFEPVVKSEPIDAEDATLAEVELAQRRRRSRRRRKRSFPSRRARVRPRGRCSRCSGDFARRRRPSGVDEGPRRRLGRDGRQGARSLCSGGCWTFGARRARRSPRKRQ